MRQLLDRTVVDVLAPQNGNVLQVVAIPRNLGEDGAAQCGNVVQDQRTQGGAATLNHLLKPFRGKVAAPAQVQPLQLLALGALADRSLSLL